MVAGQQPFRGENLLSISNAILGDDPPSLVERSAALDHIVLRALDKHRAQRYESVQDLTDQLRRISGGAGMPPEAGVERAAKRTEIVFVSSAIQHLLDQVRAVAGTDATVLIQGESGVGKELIAPGFTRRVNVATGPLLQSIVLPFRPSRLSVSSSGPCPATPRRAMNGAALKRQMVARYSSTKSQNSPMRCRPSWRGRCRTRRSSVSGTTARGVPRFATSRRPTAISPNRSRMDAFDKTSIFA